MNISIRQLPPWIILLISLTFAGEVINAKEHQNMDKAYDSLSITLTHKLSTKSKF